MMLFLTRIGAKAFPLAMMISSMASVSPLSAAPAPAPGSPFDLRVGVLRGLPARFHVASALLMNQVYPQGNWLLCPPTANGALA